MSDSRLRPVLSIGECMVELARGDDGRFDLACGGDTFNMAVYLARAGCQVDYGTALGDDPYSSRIIAAARSEGVGTGLIEIMRDRSAGLYLIETNAAGERTFHYWRDQSPARDLFEPGHGGTIVRAMSEAGVVLFSGITLSLYSARGLDRFADALVMARARGARIVMDGNYRPRGWRGDLERARTTFDRFWRLADLALPTLEDEAMLWGTPTPSGVIERLRGLGVREIVVKLGEDGAFAAEDAAMSPFHVPVPSKVTAVDTSAAGDSFNAAYLAQRLKGANVNDAVIAGHRLAGIVVQHRGAIAPREATEVAFDR
jgi:2-dehydro-3-deoxygluconokinase